MLFLHGIGSSSESFASQLSGLSDVLTMVAWDAPGYAESDTPDYPLDLDGFVGRASVLADHEFGTDAIHVLGVSWGGVLALRFAATHPSRVRSLTVIGASLGSGVDPERASAMRARPAELERLGVAEFAARRSPRLLSADADPTLVTHVTETLAASVRPSGFAAAAEVMAATDLTADVGGITAPTLILAGSADAVTGPVSARAIADKIVGSALVIVPGAGHLAHQERPDVVNAWIRGFTHIADLLGAAR
jgi:3-oxoadipate enol-lactonase